MKKNDIKNPIKATLISSLAAPLPFLIMLLANFIWIEEFHLLDFIQILGFLLIVMIFAFPFTCIINFVLVLPMAILLSRINSLYGIYLCLWCSLIAFPAFSIYMRILNGDSTTKIEFLQIILTTICGLCSGIVFCRIAKIRLKPFHLT